MGTDPSGAEPYPVSVETCDLDEAREICGEQLYPQTLRVIGGPARPPDRGVYKHNGRAVAPSALSDRL